MTGGLIQIASLGTQDTYLTGNPKITYFESVYKRHTNFASEFIELSFNGVINFGNKINIKIPRSADLISKMCVIVKLNEITNLDNNFAWVKRLGHALLKNITISIGGNIIDSQCGLWLDIWYELTKKKDHEKGYNIMIGNIKKMIKYNKKDKPEYTLYIPLQFWFNKFYNLSIPIICLNQNYDININLHLEDLQKLIIVSKNFNYDSFCKKEIIKNVSLLVNYIYLDDDERKKFTNSSHEYLIDQIQKIGPYKINNKSEKYKINFNFNKSIKELFWVTRYYTTGQQYLFYDPLVKKNPKNCLENASKKIIIESISDDNSLNIDAIKIFPYTKVSIGSLYICNKRKSIMFINTKSLIYNNVNYLDKISATIIIDEDISIDIIKTDLTIYDISIPVCKFIDTRFTKHDPMVYDPFNYGLLLDGSINPTKYGKILFGIETRVDKREGEYFNYVEPEKRHSCIPKDGLNIYSFSLYPEEFQPSGAATIKFEMDLELWNKQIGGNLTILCCNYNILRVNSGIIGLAF